MRDGQKMITWVLLVLYRIYLCVVHTIFDTGSVQLLPTLLYFYGAQVYWPHLLCSGDKKIAYPSCTRQAKQKTY